MRPSPASCKDREPGAFGLGLRPGGSAPRAPGVEGGAATRARASRERGGGATRAPPAVITVLLVVAQALLSRGARLGHPGPGIRQRLLWVGSWDCVSQGPWRQPALQPGGGILL